MLSVGKTGGEWQWGYCGENVAMELWGVGFCFLHHACH